MVKASEPFENRTPFKNGTPFENRPKSTIRKPGHVRFSDRHCNCYRCQEKKTNMIKRANLVNWICVLLTPPNGS